MKRVRFDDVIAELAKCGCESMADLTQMDRGRLVALYMRENAEWGDALFDNMEAVFSALENRDFHTLGGLIAGKLHGYVGPYVDKQLAYKAMCRREQEELRA